MIVDVDGVDTLWRVLLFLGCGALFLITSRQLEKSAAQASTQRT